MRLEEAVGPLDSLPSPVYNPGRSGISATEGCGVFRPFDDEPKQFDGFGPSWLANDAAPPASEIALAADDAGSRKLLRSQCPTSPGVYGMIDADGKLIYVGKSKSLKDRLLSYFTGQGLDSKARRIISYTRRLLWETAPHEFAALVRELELIRRWCPRFNVRGRPGRIRRAYVGLGRAPAPYVYLADKPSKRDRLLLGPLRPTRDLQRMVRQVNDWFQLRDCPDRVPMAFSDQLELFEQDHCPGCLRYELGTCLGPCAAGCSSRQYGDRARAARDFLRGTSQAALERLERAMREAAAAEQFERAAALRDTWNDLGELHELLERLKTVRQTYSFVYPIPSYARGESWYLIHRGQVVAVAPGPRGRRATNRCVQAVDAVYAQNPPTLSQTTPDDPELILLVSQWFRTHPDELGRTLSPEQAKNQCCKAAVS